MFIEPHLDIVALGSDSCLSTPDLLIAGVVHRELELLAHEFQGRLADPNAGRAVPEFESLTVVAQLTVERGGNRLQLE